MAVKIRLKRTGMPKQASYRVVVTDTRSPRDGAVLDNLGYYMPYRKAKPLEINIDEYNSWVNKGAIPTEAVRRLIKNLGKKGGSPAVRAKAGPVEAAAEGPSEAPPAEDSTTTPAKTNATEEAQ